MIELKDWLRELKTDNSELNEFITKLEGFISETGFNTMKFERAVEVGLKQKEDEIRKTFETDVENKENND